MISPCRTPKLWKAEAEAEGKHPQNLNATILTLWALDTLSLWPACGTQELVLWHDLSVPYKRLISLKYWGEGGCLGSCVPSYRRLSCLESASVNTDDGSAVSEGPPAWEQLAEAAQHFVQLSFHSQVLHCPLWCLPSIPFRLFLHCSWKVAAFLLARAPTTSPGSWGWDTLGGEKKPIQGATLYHDSSTRGLLQLSDRDLQRTGETQRGSEALEARARDVPTSVVSEGRAAFNTISSPTSAPIFFLAPRST